MNARLFFLLLAMGWTAPSALLGQKSTSAFEEGSQSAGLAAFTLESGTPEKRYIMEAMSGGVCLFDYNNDGWVDVYLVNGGTLASFRGETKSPLMNALFLNMGKRHFRNVTTEAGVGGNGTWGMGCSVADYNNDGFLDLYVTSYGNNVLYHNRGDGTFEDITAKADVNDARWSTGSCWSDFDRDGDLDLFVANYLELDPQHLPQPGSNKYGSMGTSNMGCQFLGYSVMCGPRGLKGSGDSFFLNLGNGAFKRTEDELGLADEEGYYGLGCLWSDFDDDGFPDLYVANDMTPNLFYHNRGDGRFEEIGLISGSAVSEIGLEQAGMGVTAGDWLNDGKPSIFVTNFSEDYSTLYRNEGRTNFTDVTAAAGIRHVSLPFVSWGTFMFDYDNDRWLDIFVANGHVFPQVERVENRAIGGYRQRNLLFHNLRNGRFQELGETAGLQIKAVSRGAAFADLDNDGRLDYVVTNLDAAPSLFWNVGKTKNHYLRLKLVGTTSNRAAIGSRVRLRTGETWQTQEIHSGSSYLSQNDLQLHFGLGTSTSADEVVIRWPSGKTSNLKAVPGNQTITVLEK